MSAVCIMWFRRDLRLSDNVALFHALNSGLPVVPVFIFDVDILKNLQKRDRRVQFIHETLMDINETLIKLHSRLFVYNGKPDQVWRLLINTFEIKAVYTNHDYEPYAIKRDNEIEQLMSMHSISFYTFKDQVIFEKDEVTKDDMTPYKIFTPYSKKWKAMLSASSCKSFDTEQSFNQFYKSEPQEILSLHSLGFEYSNCVFPKKSISKDIIKNYNETRDIPEIMGTSRLSIHLRFGTISIRPLMKDALENNMKFADELIWREFYMMILFHFPYVDRAFKPEYDKISWINDEVQFEAWKNGQTGYPIVDAGMRELKETGFMHNRVRMITASFLTKHLLIDWRWGEAWFAENLLDFELASNNGGWQWAASSGCDAAPYFRIFNPWLQTEKFDPQHHYIKKWVPEYLSIHYPKPIVEHNFARNRVIETYSKALGKTIPNK